MTEARTSSARATAAGGERRTEDTTHAGLMEALRDDKRTSTLMAKMQFMARTRYGIRAQDAEDIFHDAVTTYLTIHSRYPAGDNHFGLVVGIYQRKALEFLDVQRRTGRVAQRYVTRLQSDRPVVARGEDPAGDVADRVIRDEDAASIRAAIRSLRGEGRELLLALAEGEATRLEMIQSLGLNRNTFDTRLRALRLKLKKALEEAGVPV